MFNQFNALHASLNEEIHDIREKNTSVADARRNSFLYEDGSVVLPVHSDNWRQIARGRVEGHDRRHYEYFFGNSDHSGKINEKEIMKVQGNKEILASFANMMVQPEHKGKFYGMTISFDGKKMNPLHPMIASMITAGEIHIPETFTIIVYPYMDTQYLNEDYSEEYSRDIIELITRVREEQHLPTISHRASNNLESDTNGFLLNDSYSVSFREEGSNVPYALIPVQLATNGITYPYYGLIESRRADGAYSSRNLFPCLSGNVDTIMDGRGNTCVGDLSNSMFASLYVLANMNIQSLYYQEVVTDAVYDFVHASITVSSAFLSAWAGINKEDETPAETETPLEEANTDADGSCEPCSA